MSFVDAVLVLNDLGKGPELNHEDKTIMEAIDRIARASTVNSVSKETLRQAIVYLLKRSKS